MKNVLFLVAFFSFNISLHNNAEAYEPTAEKMIQFADFLYARSDYYRAITEYERVKFDYPKSTYAQKAGFQIGMSYFMGEKYDLAAIEFRELSNAFPGDEMGKDALYMLGESYFQLKDFNQAFQCFDAYINMYPPNTYHDNAIVRLGDTLLLMGQWDQARDTYKKNMSLLIPNQGVQSRDDLVLEYESMKKKSPAVAGSLSAIVPGAGQLYVNRRSDAAMALLINGALIFGTISTFGAGLPVVGCALLGLETTFYSGTIYNAKSSAYKYNQQTEELFFEKLSSQDFKVNINSN